MQPNGQPNGLTASTTAYLKFRAEKDARRVREVAHYVLDMTPQGIVVRENEKPILNVLAIIGPGEVRGEHVPSAVLLEIGVSFAVPYKRVMGPRTALERRALPPHLRHGIELYRPRICRIDPETYAAISPKIFSVLQDITDRRVATWKTWNGFLCRKSIRTWYNRRKGFVPPQGRCGTPRPARFRVMQDEFIARDVYWLTFSNPRVKQYLTKFARAFDKVTNCYGKSASLRARHVENFTEEIRARLSADKSYFEPYLFAELENYLPCWNGRENPNRHALRHVVSRAIGWNGKKTKEKLIAESAIPDPETRLRGVILHDATSRHAMKTGRKIGKGTLPFDLVANPDRVREIRKELGLSEKTPDLEAGQEEIPF